MHKEYFAARDSVELKKLNIDKMYRVNYVFVDKEKVIRVYFYNWSHQQEARKELVDFIKTKMIQTFRFTIEASPDFLKLKTGSITEELKLQIPELHWKIENNQIRTEATTAQFLQFKNEVTKIAKIEASEIKTNSWEINILKLKNPQDARDPPKIKEIADKYEVLARIPHDDGSHSIILEGV